MLLYLHSKLEERPMQKIKLETMISEHLDLIWSFCFHQRDLVFVSTS
jgi:hypothetical protein